MVNDEPIKEYNLYNQSFLPSFEIRPLSTTLDLDILEENQPDEDSLHIDLAKMNKYIKFQLNIRTRINGKSKYIVT